MRSQVEPQTAGSLPALRVLIAEDETLIRLDLAETLAELGMDVDGAVSNGQ